MWCFNIQNFEMPAFCLFLIFHPVFTNSERTCDKEFIIRRAATNRVLNVLRHWVSKHSQVCLYPPLSVHVVCVGVCVWVQCFAGVIKSAVSLKQVIDAFSLCSTAPSWSRKQQTVHKHTPNIVLTGQLAQPAYSCAKQPASNELNIKVIACLPAEIFTL